MERIKQGKRRSHRRSIAMLLAVFMVFTAVGNGSIMQVAAEGVTPSDTIEIWDGSVADSYAGGTGTSSDPYQIANGAQLAKLAKDVNSGTDDAAHQTNKYFILTADIKMNDTTNWSEWGTTPPANQWTAIGREGASGYRFQGNFNGNGHTISGLYSKGNVESDLGLFGYSWGEIKNVGVLDSYLESTNQYARVGGIAAQAVIVRNCYSNAIIKAAYRGGGIIATKIAKPDGLNSCFFYGTVTAPTAGGVYAVLVTSAQFGKGHTTNCYYLNTSAAQGTSYGDCLGEAEPRTLEQFRSGWVGVTLNSGRFDTSIEFKQESGADFPSFTGETCSHTHAYQDGFCNICNTADSSYLTAVDGFYQIETLQQYLWAAQMVKDGNNSINIKLMNDMDLSSIGKVSIGTSGSPYKGIFDGDGHKIKVNYTGITAEYCGGVFDYVQNATIKNLTVTGNISSSNHYVGGVAGKVTTGGTFINVHSAVDITSTFNGDNTHGGIAAVADPVTMTNCAYTGSITNEEGTNCGGMVGWSNSSATFTNCYMAGTMALKSSDTGSATFSRGNGVTVTNGYYLNAYGTVQGIAKTVNEFASGEVAWLLNGSYDGETFTPGATDGMQVWYQNLSQGGDAYPVLKSTGSNTVYKNGDRYSNAKAFDELTALISEVTGKLNEGQYDRIQYTTASIDNLRKALIAADGITEASEEAAIVDAYRNLVTASTVGDSGLVAATKHILIAYADDGMHRGTYSGTGWYANGDTVVLNATASMGYAFKGWTTTGTYDASQAITNTEHTFVIDTDTSETYYLWFDKKGYTVTCNSSEGGSASADKESYSYGDTATVTAVPDNNYVFAGWVDAYGITVSTEASYHFTLLGNTVLTPQFIKTVNDQNEEITYVSVNFYHQTGQLLSSQKVAASSGTVTEPIAPTKGGHTFMGWTDVKGGTEPIEDIANLTFAEDTNLYPVFVKDAVTYTLTVDGEQYGGNNGSYEPQTVITLTADPITGKKFVGWTNEAGDYVSYDTEYRFIIAGDTTLHRVYVKETDEVQKLPTIIMDSPVYDTTNTDYYKMTFFMNYSVPGGYQLVDIGVLRLYNMDKSEEGITFDTENVVSRSLFAAIGAQGQLYYTKANYYKDSHTVCAYMVYEDSSNNRYTIYSNAIYGHQ